MKSFTLLAFAILEGAILGEATTSLLHCTVDDCLRALKNTQSIAFSICNTHIASTTVTTITPTVTISSNNTVLPTLSTPIPGKFVVSSFSSQCGLATFTPLDVRLSSACSCISVSNATVTSTAIAAAVTTVIDRPTPRDLSKIQGGRRNHTTVTPTVLAAGIDPPTPRGLSKIQGDRGNHTVVTPTALAAVAATAVDHPTPRDLSKIQGHRGNHTIVTPTAPAAVSTNVIDHTNPRDLTKIYGDGWNHTTNNRTFKIHSNKEPNKHRPTSLASVGNF